MATNQAGVVTKLKWSLPWLVRYPLWRAAQILVAEDSVDLKHIILVVANHFEPGVGRQAIAPVDRWCRLARSTGNSLRDHDQTLFRHTYFFPAEQYDCRSIEKLSALQADGLGEVEVHLHHGVEKPDDASNTHRLLETFRDTLAQRHRCLSRDSESSLPQYAFVHGNSALANSAGGRNCGVDSEMEVLASTGCYADFTLPSAPDQSQVPKINSIYQCGNPLEQARPHRSGPDLKVGEKPMSNSVASVLLPKIAANADSAATVQHTTRVTRLALWGTGLSAIALALLATQAIPWLYGEPFRPSVSALLWLLPGIVIFSIANVLAAYIAGIGKPRLNLYVSGVSLIITVTLDLLLIPRLNIVGAAIASTASYSVAAFLLVFFFIRETGVSLREVLLPSSEDLGLAVQLAEPVLKRLRAQRAV